MIQKILYNCEADCTVLIRKPHVISGEGARHLRPPRRSAPGYHHLTNVTNLYLLAATETKRCYVTIKHLNLNFPQQCNLKVYSRWLWIFLSLKSPEEWEITKQACRDESVFSFLLPIYIYIYIYTRFQKGFHMERYIDRYIFLFCCTCALAHFSLLIVQLVKKLGSTINSLFVRLFVPICQ